MARESILVVDDEQEILELVNYNLAKEGYNVVGVGTGEDALAAIRGLLDPLADALAPEVRLDIVFDE